MRTLERTALDNLSLERLGPQEVQQALAERARNERLRQNWTQDDLAHRAGVSLGSLKRFERTGQVSLQSLLKIAMALDALSAFETLFGAPEFASLDEVLAADKPTRSRASRRSSSQQSMQSDSPIKYKKPTS